MSFSDALRQSAGQFALILSEEQIAAFQIYYTLLVEWNQKMNLTAITDPEEVAVKHMIDSLSCYQPEVFPAGCRVIDVGTGAGFPGLPLKIMHADLKLTLLDSLNKRVNFLRHVADSLSLKQVDVIHSRAEEGARNKQFREQYDVAVSRAVARLNVLAELCIPFVKPGGYFIALKGAQFQQEVEEAGRAIQVLGGEVAQVRPVKLPGLEDIRAVVYIKKVRTTPSTYPRKPGQPEKKPL